MKTNFLKSVTTGITLIGLTSACSMMGHKDGAHKCGGKNSCNGKAAVKDEAHKCAAKNSCNAKNSCKAGAVNKTAPAEIITPVEPAAKAKSK